MNFAGVSLNAATNGISTRLFQQQRAGTITCGGQSIRMATCSISLRRVGATSTRQNAFSASSSSACVTPPQALVIDKLKSYVFRVVGSCTSPQLAPFQSQARFAYTAPSRSPTAQFMTQALHSQARTTHLIREEIRASSLSQAALARLYNVTRQTIRKSSAE